MAQEFLEKLPPQNIEAEKSLLGCLMIDPEAILKVVDSLTPKDFYKENHQKIYQVMVEIFDRREPIDSNYAKIVQQKRILRDLIGISQQIGELAYQEAEDVDVLLDEAEKRIFSIAQNSLTQKFVPVKETLEETFRRIEELSAQKGGLRGIPTGFRALDNILAGLQKSDLIILAARPSMGKSAMATDIARNVACRYKVPVGIFSLEMSKDQIVDRLIAAEADIDLWRLRTGRLSDHGEDNDFERIQRAMGILSEAPIYIDDVSSSNILQMRAMARRLQSDAGLGLLIVDYLQLMEPRNPTLSMVQQVTENSKALKSLAKELNIPVLVLSQLSRAVEQRTPQIPRLADLRESGCLTGDTLITRADTGERIPIKDLEGKSNIPVHALDEDWKVRVFNISKVFCSGNKMVYEMTLRSGRKIKASGNHPFRKLEGWARLDQLQIGDYIATPKILNFSLPKNGLSKEEIILLAHLLGDGCVLPRQPIHYTSSDRESIKIVGYLAKKLFNIKPRIVRQKNWQHIYLPSPYRLCRGKHHPIINFYHRLSIKPVRSWNKEIPQKIFMLDNERIALFLHHLWATDGNVSPKRLKERKLNASIYYSTTSEKLAEGVNHLLLRLGIRSKIVKAKKQNYRICYQIQIQGKEHQLRFLKKVGCFGERGKIVPFLVKILEEIKTNTNVDIWPKESWKLFINPVREKVGVSWREFSKGIETSYGGSSLFKSGIGMERLNKIASFFGSEDIFNMANSDVFWDEIISIRPIGVEKVYDATVPGVHNFVANDIIVHNSIEQDADVVLFIYREDRYRPDTERKNIADIIIAKHRNGPVGKVELYFDEPRVSFRDIEKSYEEMASD